MQATRRALGLSVSPTSGNPSAAPSVRDLEAMGWRRQEVVDAQLQVLRTKLAAEVAARAAAELALAFKEDEVDERRAQESNRAFEEAEDAAQLRAELLALQRKLDEEQQRAAKLQASQLLAAKARVAHPTGSAGAGEGSARIVDPKIGKVFKVFDSNRDGGIDANELRLALDRLGMGAELGTGAEEARRLIGRYDTQLVDGKLDVFEFNALVQDLALAPRPGYFSRHSLPPPLPQPGAPW
jgi:hypothetical protein